MPAESVISALSLLRPCEGYITSEARASIYLRCSQNDMHAMLIFPATGHDQRHARCLEELGVVLLPRFIPLRLTAIVARTLNLKRVTGAQSSSSEVQASAVYAVDTSRDRVPGRGISRQERWPWQCQEVIEALRASGIKIACYFS
jgi:hypothetical protein